MTRTEAKLKAARIKRRLLQDKVDKLSELEAQLVAVIGYDPDAGVHLTVEVTNDVGVNAAFESIRERLRSPDFETSLSLLCDAGLEIERELFTSKWEPLSSDKRRMHRATV